MPYESMKLINLQKPGNNAHSLVLIKSSAITTNTANISIFECNGQYTQCEIRIVTTDPETGTTIDVTRDYFSPVSPKLCINYGNDIYNPGYCGIFGIIAMVFFRHYKSHPPRWLRKWKQLLEYMRQEIPNEPDSHGCKGVALAAKVQEIIAYSPHTHTGFQNAEKEIIRGFRPPTTDQNGR